MKQMELFNIESWHKLALLAQLNYSIQLNNILNYLVTYKK